MSKVSILKLLTVSLLFPLLTQGQDWSKISEVKLVEEATSISIDSEGNLYIGFSTGHLKKFTNKGEQVEVYSLPNRSPITLAEAFNNRKIFLFYRDIQQIHLLDRFTSVPRQYPIADFNLYFANLACNTPDGSFWILENNPQRLIKIDPLRKSIIHEIQVELGDSINFMRAIQNLVLIADENGLHVFDLFGNYLSNFDLKDCTYVQAYKDELLVTYDFGLAKVDPYKSSITEVVEFPGPKNAILKLASGFATLNQTSLSFYSID